MGGGRKRKQKKLQGKVQTRNEKLGHCILQQCIQSNEICLSGSQAQEDIISYTSIGSRGVPAGCCSLRIIAVRCRIGSKSGGRGAPAGVRKPGGGEGQRGAHRGASARAPSSCPHHFLVA